MKALSCFTFESSVQHWCLTIGPVQTLWGMPTVQTTQVSSRFLISSIHCWRMHCGTDPLQSATFPQLVLSWWYRSSLCHLRWHCHLVNRNRLVYARWTSPSWLSTRLKTNIWLALSRTSTGTFLSMYLMPNHLHGIADLGSLILSPIGELCVFDLF